MHYFRLILRYLVKFYFEVAWLFLVFIRYDMNYGKNCVTRGVYLIGVATTTLGPQLSAAGNNQSHNQNQNQNLYRNLLIIT